MDASQHIHSLESAMASLEGSIDHLQRVLSSGAQDDIEAASHLVLESIQLAVLVVRQLPNGEAVSQTLRARLARSYERLGIQRDAQMRMSARVDGWLQAILPTDSSATYQPRSAAQGSRVGIYTQVRA